MAPDVASAIHGDPFRGGRRLIRGRGVLIRSGGRTGGGSVQNIGSSTLKGIEAQMTARIGGLGINFNGSVERSALGAIKGIRSHVRAASRLRRRPWRVRCSRGDAVDLLQLCTHAANLEGEPDLFAPAAEGTIGLDYRFNLWGGVLIPQINFSYTAKQYANLFHLPYYELGPRHIWNANLNYNVNQRNTEFFINNFIDQTYQTNAGNTVFYGVLRRTDAARHPCPQGLLIEA